MTAIPLGFHVLDAYPAVMLAAVNTGVDVATVKENVRATIMSNGVGGMLVRRVLFPKLTM